MMHLSKEFFDQLNPSYQKVIIELENALEECEKEYHQLLLDSPTYGNNLR